MSDISHDGAKAMSVLNLGRTGNILHFNYENCVTEGRRLASQYQNAEPFPHIVIDSLLDPKILREALADFPEVEGKEFFDRDQERFKFQFSPEEISAGLLRNLLIEFNSQAFLVFLEEMTGIEGLIADHFFTGGGLHETRRTGHLGIHADFNVHERLNLERRLNLLVYLNDDWDESYGGALELWDRQMTKCEVKVAPIMARAVVFNTTLDSYHGHPDPLTCPDGKTRRSMATYYYTAPLDGIASLPKRTTAFQTRPGSTDKADMKIKTEHWIRDWVPPRLQRIASRMNPF